VRQLAREDPEVVMKLFLSLFVCLFFLSSTATAAAPRTVHDIGSTSVSVAATTMRASFVRLDAINEVGRSLGREELEKMSDLDLHKRDIQLVREADAASLGEAYAYEEALVVMSEYARKNLPDSAESALAGSTLKALSPFTRDVRTSGLSPEGMARPDFRYSGPTQQSRFFALIDAVFLMKFGRFRAIISMPVTDEQLASFGLDDDTRGLGHVIEALGSKTKDPWLLAFYSDKRLKRVRHTTRYDQIEAERKLIREISNAR